MTIAAIYTRVSSKAQVAKGDGLASQESRCRVRWSEALAWRGLCPEDAPLCAQGREPRGTDTPRLRRRVLQSVSSDFHIL